MNGLIGRALRNVRKLTRIIPLLATCKDWCQLVHSLVESSCGWSAELQVDNPVSTSMNYIGSQNNTTHYSQALSHGSPEDGLTQELSTDPGYYSQSPSQLHYNRPVTMNPSGGSTQQTTPQTPNTPSSIPDIILTDFSSSTGDDLSRQEFVKDLGSAMSGSFDTDLFPSDEALREGLGPIDFDGLQMLTDPDINAITDPATEDSFRLDRL
uniref:Transducer of regulated CREB activity C-terminal domain-containing protein n=1 Tax=Timema cristinae TaxID=61476 RepID=A0A7R9H459_TIMCR|nr:unnamed protein product [Timema cristinae]